MSQLTAPGQVRLRARPEAAPADTGRRRVRYRGGYLAGVLPSVLLAGIFICAPYAGTTTVPMDGSQSAASRVGFVAGQLASGARPVGDVASGARPATAPAAGPEAGTPNAARAADNPVPFRLAGTAVLVLVASWLVLMAFAAVTIGYVARRSRDGGGAVPRATPPAHRRLRHSAGRIG